MGTEPSVAVYESCAQEWMDRRTRQYGDRLERFAARVTRISGGGATGPGPGDGDAASDPAGGNDPGSTGIGDSVTRRAGPSPPRSRRQPSPAGTGESVTRRAGPVADLGCGPGWHLDGLPQPALALDASRAMLAEVGAPAGDTAPMRVAGDLRALPLRDRCLRAAWASRSYIHLARAEVPLALADLHRVLVPDAAVELHLFAGDTEWDERPDDDFPGRRFSRWPEGWLRDVLVGAGLAVESIEQRNRVLLVAATRLHTLADTVAPGMRLLVCGLNPSLYAAEVGVGFARGSNRFWRAALAAGLASRDRDPRHALVAHNVGMTDLVKRPTRQAAELTAAEYSEGLARLERLVKRLEPGVVCFVGLAGWRAAVDRRATPGPQPRRIGGRPAYVMPSTSGLNARTSLAELTAHLRAAASLQ
ncbi:MAG: methyltransferase domain-containing protein [bacterium]|nr:methyltransferase domain-containing protein [bacterium]